MVSRNIIYAIVTIIMAYPISVFSQNPADCYPPCRSGFTCYKGNCVSICNPPCPDGQKCTDSGECIPISQPLSNSDKPDKAVKIEKAKRNIQCTEVFVVRPQMDVSTFPGNFQESELLSASNTIADAIVKNLKSPNTIITNEDIEAIQNCNSRLIIAKVKSYHTERAILGQYTGVITISISSFNSPRQEAPTSIKEFNATGARHWGQLGPLQNALHTVCRDIERYYKD